MPSQNNTDSQSVPTQKQDFFVLNPQAKLSDLLWLAICLNDRAKGLIGSAAGGDEYGLNPHMLLSILNGATTAVEQVGAILDRFQEVEQKSAETAKTVRPLNDDERTQFLSKLQQRSALMANISGSVQEKEIYATQRNLMLEGMVELFDLLNAIGVHVPADVASIVESEMGRVGQ